MRETCRVGATGCLLGCPLAVDGDGGPLGPHLDDGSLRGRADPSVPGYPRRRWPPTRPVRARPAGRASAARARGADAPPRSASVRNGLVEAVHRGDVVEVDAAGGCPVIGDPTGSSSCGATVKPFGVIALLEAGGIEAFDLRPAEIALMASSHSGEDLHVRTLQALYRAPGSPRRCWPAATRHAARCPDRGPPRARWREGRAPSATCAPASTRCSSCWPGSRAGRWTAYWEAEHPAQVAYRGGRRVFGVRAGRARTGIDGCGILTYAFPLREVAQAYAVLADPARSPPPTRDRVRRRPRADPRRDDPHPEMVAGTRDRLDTSLMKALRAAREQERAWRRCAGRDPARRPAATARGRRHGGQDRGRRRLRPGDVRGIGRGAPPGRRPRGPGAPDAARYHRPPILDPHGRVGAEAIPEFELAPVGELTREPTRATAPAPYLGDPHRGVARRVAQRDQVGVPAAREAVPPRRGRGAALPRFLAIQAAYERLVDGEGQLAVDRPGGGQGGAGMDGRTGRARAT